MTYLPLMSDPVNEKKFEARIPMSLWDAYEQWAKGRGKIGNRQLLVALLRLFLNSPEWMQMMALYAKDDRLNIEAGLRQSRLEFLLADDERRIESERKDPLRSVRAIVDHMQPEAIRLLSAEEQKEVDELRRLLGATETKKEHKKKTS